MTGYRDGDRLITESILYEKGDASALAIVKANVADDKLEKLFLMLSGLPTNGRRK